jgi:hypothetical protein
MAEIEHVGRAPARAPAHRCPRVIGAVLGVPDRRRAKRRTENEPFILFHAATLSTPCDRSLERVI